MKLDPGLAFGTGTHPTTALCLEWMDANLQAGSSVIDYGCGSGILAIAAAKLGARHASCFDIDPQALIATRDNATANDVGARVQVYEAPDDLPRPVDFLVANILSGPLCELAPSFAALVAPGRLAGPGRVDGASGVPKWQRRTAHGLICAPWKAGRLGGSLGTPPLLKHHHACSPSAQNARSRWS